MKRADVEKVCHHRVDHRDLMRAPQYGGCVIQPGAWRGHAHYGYCLQEGCTMKNEGGKLKIGFYDIALKIC